MKKKGKSNERGREYVYSVNDVEQETSTSRREKWTTKAERGNNDTKKNQGKKKLWLQDKGKAHGRLIKGGEGHGILSKKAMRGGDLVGREKWYKEGGGNITQRT